MTKQAAKPPAKTRAATNRELLMGYDTAIELEAVLLEHGCDGSQVCLCLGLLLELLGSLLLHVVSLRLDLALGLDVRCNVWRWGGERKG